MFTLDQGDSFQQGLAYECSSHFSISSCREGTRLPRPARELARETGEETGPPWGGGVLLGVSHLGQTGGRQRPGERGCRWPLAGKCGDHWEAGLDPVSLQGLEAGQAETTWLPSALGTVVRAFLGS